MIAIFCSLLLYNHFNPVIFVQSIDHKQSLNHSTQVDLRNKFVPLPQSVINGVKYFVYFLAGLTVDTALLALYLMVIHT